VGHGLANLNVRTVKTNGANLVCITDLFLYDSKLAKTVGLDKFTCNFASHFIWIKRNDLFLANF
jgi:hypothetical protein